MIEFQPRLFLDSCLSYSPILYDYYESSNDSLFFNQILLFAIQSSHYRECFSYSDQIPSFAYSPISASLANTMRTVRRLFLVLLAKQLSPFHREVEEYYPSPSFTKQFDEFVARNNCCLP